MPNTVDGGRKLPRSVTDAIADANLALDRIAHPLRLPDVHPRPADRTPLQGVTPTEVKPIENDQSAEEARRIVKAAVLSFSEFPAGVEYGDKIWIRTNIPFEDQHRRQGEIIAGVTNNGDLKIYEAFRMPNEEWDLEGASSRPANDDEVLQYSRLLMTEIELRVDEARTKEFATVVFQKLPRNTERANHLTAAYRTTRQAVQELSILEAQRKSAHLSNR